MDIDKLHFLNEEQIREIARSGTPAFVYSKRRLQENAKRALAFQSPFGLSVRFAMKANPHPEILQLFNQAGVYIDASSGGEVEKAIRAGFAPGKIRITAQQMPDNLAELLDKGVHFTACSLHQLETYGKIAPGTNIGIRINPGAGEGLNNRLTTGGAAASFGIWHEYIDRVHKLAKQYDLTINLLHNHCGTGTKPEGWLKVAQRLLELLDKFPDATHASLGGGFKVARMRDEESADLQKISAPIAESMKKFEKRTGRKIHLEIEPGNFLVTNAGTLISQIIDSKDTGSAGYNFLIVNAGMTEILRPSLYGAQHPLVVVTKEDRGNEEIMEYAVSGHCCESGDMLTVAPGDPETIKPRQLQKARIGDYLCIEGVGSYCASMCAKMYNSFPLAREIFID